MATVVAMDSYRRQTITKTTTTTTTTTKTQLKSTTGDGKGAEVDTDGAADPMLLLQLSNAKLCTLDDVDDLLARLTAEEIEELGRADPDDRSLPASLRCSYKCAKPPTPKLDRARLLRSLKDDLSPDREDPVAFVPGVVRGKKFRKKTEVPEQQKEDDDDDDDEPVDFASKLSKEEAEEYERFFADASMDDLREMADILGVTYQDHCAATELKLYPDPEPQESDVEAVVRRAEEADPQLVAVNFNNIKTVDPSQWRRLFSSLSSPSSCVRALSLANCGLTDADVRGLTEALASAAAVSSAVEPTPALEELTLDSNLLSASAVLELLRAGRFLVALRVSNQLNCRFLGHRVESSVVDILASGNNPRLVNLGIVMEFRSCLNRVAVQLQRNLDKKRRAKLKSKEEERQQQS